MRPLECSQPNSCRSRRGLENRQRRPSNRRLCSRVGNRTEPRLHRHCPLQRFRQSLRRPLHHRARSSSQRVQHHRWRRRHLPWSLPRRRPRLPRRPLLQRHSRLPLRLLPPLSGRRSGYTPAAPTPLQLHQHPALLASRSTRYLSLTVAGSARPPRGYCHNFSSSLDPSPGTEPDSEALTCDG